MTSVKNSLLSLGIVVIAGLGVAASSAQSLGDSDGASAVGPLPNGTALRPDDHVTGGSPVSAISPLTVAGHLDAFAPEPAMNVSDAPTTDGVTGQTGLTVQEPLGVLRVQVNDPLDGFGVVSESQEAFRVAAQTFPGDEVRFDLALVNRSSVQHTALMDVTLPDGVQVTLTGRGAVKTAQLDRDTWVVSVDPTDPNADLNTTVAMRFSSSMGAGFYNVRFTLARDTRQGE